jgi:hypothetical protein
MEPEPSERAGELASRGTRVGVEASRRRTGARYGGRGGAGGAEGGVVGGVGQVHY